MNPHTSISENTPWTKAIGSLAGLKMMALAIMVVVFGLTSGAQTVVQSKSGFATGSTNPAVAFPSNNTAGNLLWVAVGSDATITTPTDTQGNSYTQAVSVTGSGGSGNAAIYYVTSAKAGANTVTCNHSGNGDTHCHIAEISGLITSSPLDVTGSVASSATCSVSTSAATTQANEWIAAFFYDSPNSRTLTAGTNYTQIQLSNNTSAGDAAISESQNVSSTGTQTATCGGNSSDVLSQLITTFKAQNNSSGPSISSLSPTSGPVGTSVTISGSNFGSSQGSSTVTFNGTTATPTSWSSTSIVAPVPSGATTGNVVVTVGGTASNGVSFTVTSSAPSISSLSPTSGPVGTSVTISGSNFGSSQGSSTVTFNSTAATPTSWSSTSIAAPVPSGATTGKVVVTVGGTASNGVNFTVTSSAPSISSLSPTSGPVGTSVTITGTNFGSSQGSSTVTFNGTTATPTSWSSTSIAAPVPNGATTGNVVVTVGGTASNGVGFTVGNGGSSPNVVQSKSGFATGSTNPAVAFPSNNTAGNLLWVAVGSDATITTPTDTQGNTYTLAVSVTGSGGSGNAAVYYVTSAKAGANTVTCNHSGNGDTHCHIAEISGLVTSSPLDVTGSVASSATCSVSTSAATTQGNEWIAAFFYDSPNSRTLTAGTNYTQIQLSNNTSAGDAAISESQNVSSTGTQKATCGGNSSDVLSQLITTFKAQNNSSGPSISSLSPTSGPVGTSVTISGSNFGSSQGSSTVTFNGTAATPTSWSSTSIVAPAPSGATTGNVVVTVGGTASNGVSFTVAPSITSLTPNSGSVGSSIVIAGSNFGATQGNGGVTFNGTAATVSSWSNTSITAVVPTGAMTGNIVVTAAGGVSSAGVPFSVVAAPSITGLTPGSAPVGSTIIITGTNFGNAQGNGGVTFNGTAAAVNGWSSTSITTMVPPGATTGNVVVTVAGGVATPGALFTVVSAPSISSLSPSSGPVGTSVTITGTNFGSGQGNGSVTFNATPGTVSAWSNTSITVTVPIGATTGNMVVTAAGGVPSGGISFTVVPTPSIASLTPGSGPVGSAIVIAGNNFGLTQSNGAVTFNGAAATVSSWSNTSITAAVPTGATTGNVVVTAAGGVASSGVSFTVVPAPSISSLSPNSGLVGSSVTIAGTNFGPNQGNGNVSFNGTAASVSSWSNTSIAATVPTGATSGNVVATAAGGVSSNGVSFTVTNPPAISSLSPTSGNVGTSVTINGSNFGSSQGSSTVAFNGTAATPSSWNSTQIVAAVPASASTGNVVVTVGGAASNGVSFTVTGPPTINSLSPTSGPVGTPVTITGTNFGTTQGSSLVMFSDESIAATPTSWSNTKIMVTVPQQASTGNVNVTVNGTASNGINFTVSSGGISTSPTSGAVGTSVTISGSNFGASQGSSTVTFGLVTATPSSWSNTQIVAPVPNGVATGFQVLSVTVGGNTASTSFDILPAITSLSPSTSALGSSVTINGTSFGSSSGTNTFVTFSNQNVAATPTSWSPTQIVVTVPTGATTGNVNVTVNGAVSNGVNFTVSQTQTPSITSLLPASGAVGSSVVISGTDFGSTQGSVTFNGTAATVTSWSSTSVNATVPTGASTGNVVVTAANVASNGVTFTVTPGPNISSMSPSAALVGAQVTINGTHFGTPPAVGAVSFNGTTATIITWTDTSILVSVPAGASSGNVVVTDDGGVASNGVNFTIQTPYSFTVTYAPNGDVLTANDSVNGSWTYTYDDFNRLSTAVATNGTGCAESYDQYGNRWTQQPHGTGNSCLSSSFSFTGNNTGNNNRIDTYSYDAAGNLLNDGNFSYTYDAENRIISVNQGQTVIATYVYDAEGRRIRKVTSAGIADFIYDQDDHVIAEVSGTGAWNRGEIYAGSRHIATYANGTTYFNQSDWVGTERARNTLSDSQCETITSLPFGDGMTATGSCGDPSPLHFTGKQRDTESGLDYFGARYYGSAFGRFNGPDEAFADQNKAEPQSWNLYSYGRNNPTRVTDANGRSVFICIKLADIDSEDESTYQCTFVTDEAYLAAQADPGPGIEAPKLGESGSIYCGGEVCGFAQYVPCIPCQQDAIIPLTLGPGDFILAGPARTFFGGLARAGEEEAAEAAARAARMARVRAAGKAGEVAAGIAGNTKRIPSLTGEVAFRVPDVLDEAAGVIGEVKNVPGTLSLTSQIVDDIAYASEKGLKFELHVVPGVTFTKPLQELINAGIVKIVTFIP